MTERQDHSYMTYGVVRVGVPEVTDKRGAVTYGVTWLCCGTKGTQTYSQLNCQKNEPRSRCFECRKANRPGIEVTLETNPAAITVPGWGRFLPMGQMGHRYGNDTNRTYGKAGVAAE